MIGVEGLGKRYGSRWLFRDLTFQIQEGDSLVVTGHNGSGKSTLLRCLAGLVRPNEGKVLGPEDHGALGLASLEIHLYPWLDAVEHLEFAAESRGCEARAEEILEFIGLVQTAWRGLPASRFSTGMKARLRMALAIQSNPKVLLLDEPGAGLDARGREVVGRVIAAQRARGCVILATNDPLEEGYASHALDLGG